MIRVTIHCDRCDHPGATGASALEARRSLKKHGWLVNQPGGADICPACRLAYREEQKRERT